METIDRMLEGRVRDLVSTADRQLASQSYDAAIDTYRTALGELPGDCAAVRADIEERLATAGRARETSQQVAGLLAQARYHQTAGRLSPAYAAVAAAQSLDPANLAAAQLRAQLIAALPELTAQAAPPAGQAEPVLAVAPELPAPSNVLEAKAAELPQVEPPEPAPSNALEAKAAEPPEVEPPQPAPARPEADAPIEPPSFWQFEDDLRFSETPHRRECGTEPELLSILNPAPAPPEEPDSKLAKAIPGIIAAVLAILVGTIFSSSSHHRRAPSTEFTRPAVSAVDDRVYRAGSEVTAPILLSKVEPEYTEEALRAQLQGTVVLYAQIDPSGNAVNLHVLRGLGMGLDARAIEAASRWRFQPGMRNGTPVTVETNLEVNFRLP